jgi:hypothetical protein
MIYEIPYWTIAQKHRASLARALSGFRLRGTFNKKIMYWKHFKTLYKICIKILDCLENG